MGTVQRDKAFSSAVFGNPRLCADLYRTDNFSIFIPLSSLLPIKMSQAIGDYVGFFSFMDTFIGREKKK